MDKMTTTNTKEPIEIVVTLGNVVLSRIDIKELKKQKDRRAYLTPLAAKVLEARALKGDKSKKELLEEAVLRTFAGLEPYNAGVS